MAVPLRSAAVAKRQALNDNAPRFCGAYAPAFDADISYRHQIRTDGTLPYRRIRRLLLRMGIVL